MPVEGPVHANRARAESFGGVAADYDRYRPGYPQQLIDDLVALSPASVLDIGCGTGKAARLLAERGLRVLGVEIDPDMAAVAVGHGLDVELGSFEQWADRGRRFDLIISAQAWHWVDPAVGAPKAARLLVERGTMALFWNFEELDDATKDVVDRVYRDVAPELRSRTPNTPGDRLSDLRKSAVFGSLREQTYRWTRTLAAADWVGKAGTQSDHVVLGASRLAEVKRALQTALDAAGGEVRLTGGTYTIWARP